MSFKSILFCLLVLLMPVISVAQETIPVIMGSPGPQYTTLFNGKDFTGWIIEPDGGRWIVQSGVMSCLGDPQIPHIIRTDKEYENFDLYIDFKIGKGHNSGVLCHLPRPDGGRESRLGFEVQIHNGNPDLLHSTGSIYSINAASQQAEKPAGEWNQYRIRFEWPMLQVWLNGVQIQNFDFSVDELTRYRLRRGSIGLQNHHNPVQFRNVWVKALPGKTPWQDLFNGKDLDQWESIGDAQWKVVDGAIVASGGNGYLISKSKFKDYVFEAYVDSDTTKSMLGGFYYRYLDKDDPGYRVDFHNWPVIKETLKKYETKLPDGRTTYDMPPSVLNALWTQPYLLYQILSTDRESRVIINGIKVSESKMLSRVRKGHIVIHHAAGDGTFHIYEPKLRPLEGKGI